MQLTGRHFAVGVEHAGRKEPLAVGFLALLVGDGLVLGL